MKAFRLSRVMWMLAYVLVSCRVPAQGIDYDKTELMTLQLSSNVYVISGSPNTDNGHKDAAGGRIGLLVGPEGVLLVDSSYAPLNGKITAAIAKLTPSPVRFLINTHEHPDHSGGNAAIARTGAVIFSREETREALAKAPPAGLLKAIGQQADFTSPGRLPIVTYRSGATVTIHLDGETVDLISLPPGHTDGDTAVRFETADVIMIGDVYRNYGYPLIDEGHGGSFHGMLDAIDMLFTISDQKTKLVPGHGGIISKADLIPYRTMIVDVRNRVQAMVAAGQTRAEVIAAHPTSSYDAQVPGAMDQLPAGLGISADRFVGAMYDEVTTKENQK